MRMPAVTLTIETLTPRFRLDEKTQLAGSRLEISSSQFTRVDSSFFSFANIFLSGLFCSSTLPLRLGTLFEWNDRGAGLLSNVFSAYHNNFSE
jgi:hypothetical protein